MKMYEWSLLACESLGLNTQWWEGKLGLLVTIRIADIVFSIVHWARYLRHGMKIGESYIWCNCSVDKKLVSQCSDWFPVTSHQHHWATCFPQLHFHRDENSLILQRDDGEDILQIVVKELLLQSCKWERGVNSDLPLSVLTPPFLPLSPLPWSPIQDRRDLNKQQNS